MLKRRSLSPLISLFELIFATPDTHRVSVMKSSPLTDVCVPGIQEAGRSREKQGEAGVQRLEEEGTNLVEP